MTVSMTVNTQNTSSPHLVPRLIRTLEPTDNSAAAWVAVEALSVDESPRLSGENAEHVLALTAALRELPPIIVHHPTMRVIDGIHRLRVARSRGDERILVRFFYGDRADSFILAVKSNIAHGLPLSLADRRAAAVRIILSHQQWSNRMIASVTGLAARTVAEIRRLGAGSSAQEDARIGQDGRVRPINGAERRMHAASLISENPGATLRQVSQSAGISPETVRDVRNRLRLGQDPVPKGAQRRLKRKGSRPDRREPEVGARQAHRHVLIEQSAMIETVERLSADPALRFSETGRTLLRLLHAHLTEADNWEKIGDNVPPHRGDIIAELANECANMWQTLAHKLEQKAANIA